MLPKTDPAPRSMGGPQMTDALNTSWSVAGAGIMGGGALAMAGGEEDAVGERKGSFGARGESSLSGARGLWEKT